MPALNKTVLITGARGFVGAPTVAAFLAAGWDVVAACRSAPAHVATSVPGRSPLLPVPSHTPDTGVATLQETPTSPPTSQVSGLSSQLSRSTSSTSSGPSSGTYHEVTVGELGPDTDWSEALRGVDVVVHLAARVHQMNDTATDPEAEFRRVNVEGTRRLAEQAAAAGARRFVFVSSIKVNGERTSPEAFFRDDDTPAPEDAYGKSKAEAETALRQVGATTGLEIVIVRPPLMVGRGVKGNLAALAGAIRRGRPLPLGGIRDNRRSLLDVRNLADVLELCARHPAAAGQIFLLSDGVPVSTAELARHVGRAVGRAPRLLPVPASWLRAAARMLGKGAAAERLTGSLLIDDSKIRRTLGWSPRHGPSDWEV